MEGFLGFIYFMSGAKNFDITKLIINGESHNQKTLPIHRVVKYNTLDGEEVEIIEISQYPINYVEIIEILHFRNINENIHSFFAQVEIDDFSIKQLRKEFTKYDIKKTVSGILFSPKKVVVWDKGQLRIEEIAGRSKL